MSCAARNGWRLYPYPYHPKGEPVPRTYPPFPQPASVSDPSSSVPFLYSPPSCLSLCNLAIIFHSIARFQLSRDSKEKETGIGREIEENGEFLKFLRGWVGSGWVRFGSRDNRVNIIISWRRKKKGFCLHPVTRRNQRLSDLQIILQRTRE